MKTLRKIKHLPEGPISTFFSKVLETRVYIGRLEPWEEVGGEDAYEHTNGPYIRVPGITG